MTIFLIVISIFITVAAFVFGYDNGFHAALNMVGKKKKFQNAEDEIVRKDDCND